MRLMNAMALGCIPVIVQVGTRSCASAAGLLTGKQSSCCFEATSKPSLHNRLLCWHPPPGHPAVLHTFQAASDGSTAQPRTNKNQK